MTDKEKKQPAFIRQSKRYLIVGFASAAIDFGLFVLLHDLLGFRLAVNVLGIGRIISNVIAILVSTAFNFLMSRNWIFASVSSLPRSLILYIILFIINQAFSSAAIIWLTGTLGLPGFFAKFITMACIVCWNFFLYRKVVFR